MNVGALNLLHEPFDKPHGVMYEHLHQGVNTWFYNILKQQPKVHLSQVCP